MRFGHILFGVVFLLPECGVVATDDGRREQDAPEIPLDDPVAVGEAYCRRAARCGGSALLLYPGGTLEGCLTYVSCSAALPRDPRNPAGCARAMDEFPCDQSTRDACVLVGEAKLDLGEPCTNDQGAPRCRPGPYCPPEVDGCSWCERLARLGEACAELRQLDQSGKLIGEPPCSDEFTCSEDTWRCVRRPTVGEPCRLRGQCADGQCVDGLCVPVLPRLVSPMGGPCVEARDCVLGDRGQCIDGVCRPPGDVAEACDGSASSCREGLTCAEGICLAVPCGAGGEGDLCLGYCREGLYCDGETRRCHARHAEGEACPSSYRCLEGLVCDASTKVCIRPKALGEPCLGDGDCESGRCPWFDAPDAVCEPARVCE